MNENAAKHLKRIVDMLGPNMWLHVDEVILQSAFGPEDYLNEAEKFAKKNGASFIRTSRESQFQSVGAFGRAYYKE